MLDLNLSVGSSNSGSDSKGMVTEKLRHLPGSPKESSGSFNSSTVSAGDEGSTSNYDAAFAYSFSILKNSSAEELDKCNRTIQLFPATGAGEEESYVVGSGLGFGQSLRKEWLDLTSSYGGVGAEERIVATTTDTAGEEESAGAPVSELAVSRCYVLPKNWKMGIAYLVSDSQP
jgi:hypothetical protein